MTSAVANAVCHVTGAHIRDLLIHAGQFMCLLTMKCERHSYPAAIELEYEVPSGSEAVKETARCLDFCKAVLAKV